jgi:hypothetical protein
MASTTSIRRILDAILASNPDFDILNADLFHKPTLGALQMNAEAEDSAHTLDVLRTYQRVLRIYPNEDLADTLLEQGFDSAHTIAAIPEHRFVREYSERLNVNTSVVKDIHSRAVAIRARTRQVVANIRDMVASKHYKGTLFYNVDPELVEYVSNLPSYQSLFGGINYCECEHCRSMLSPAAYFLDIMRITDEYITDVNTHKSDDNIPAGFKLEERRPDLFNMYLTCANTDEEIPYLRIVDDILANRIELESSAITGTAQTGSASSITLASSSSSEDGAYTGKVLVITAGKGIGQRRSITSYTGFTRIAAVDTAWETVPDQTSVYRLTDTAYQTLATRLYPFNLPFNLPLEEIRLYLNELQTTLDTVFLDFLVPQPELPGVKEIDVAREYLHLSLEEYYIVTTPDDTTAGLSMAYGYDDITKHLPFSGTGKVSFSAGSAAVTGSDGTLFTTQLAVGDMITTNNQTRVVKNITSDTQLEVELPWSTGTTSPSDYTVEPLESLDTVYAFSYRTGLSREQVHSLLYQELDASEQASGVAQSFFINATGESLPPMEIVRAANGDPFDRISNLSLKRLDRLNRFIRLSAKTGWSYANVDWSFVSVGATEITESLIEKLASIEKLHRELGMDVDAACAMWFDMKIRGKITASNPQDLFDRVFNNPALLDGKNPYGNNQPPVPFDPSQVLVWEVDDRAGTNGTIRSRLTGALLVTDNDLTLVANFLLAMQGREDGTIQLRLENLTWLYRLTKLPEVLGMGIDEYLRMLFLIWCSAKKMKVTASTLVCDGLADEMSTIDGVMRICRAIQWQQKAPFTVYELQYIITGVRSEYVDTGYTPEGIRPFIQNLSVSAVGSHVTKASFIFDDIDADRSAKLFEAFVAQEYISDIGIVLEKIIDYASISNFFPVSRESFTGVNITPDESAQVFDLLLAESYLRSIDGTAFAKVSEVFTADSSLDFLFTNEGSGQQRSITAYDGTNRTATVQPDWATAPNNTSLYVLGTRVDIGTAQGGTADTIILASSASDVSGLYDGMTLLIESGTGAGQARVISSYNGTTKIAEMDSDWDVQPDNTSVYSVFAAGATAGTAKGGDAESILLADSASAIDDVYVGMQISVRNADGVVQFRRISAYAGADKRATVDVSWDVVPTDTSLYSVNLSVNKGQARAGSASTIQLSEAMSDETSAYDSVSVGLYNDPLAVLKRGEVRKILLQIQRDIRHTVEILLSQTTLQDSNVIDGLARFLGTQSDMVAAQLPFVAKISELTDYRRAFLTPIPEGQPVPDKVPELIEMLARGVMLARNLALSATQVYGMASNPDPYVFDTSERLTFANVQLITTYKELTIAFRDKDNHLLEYFAETDKDKKLRLLSTITDWPYQQIVTLVDLFWPANEGETYQEDYNTVGGVQRMKVGFDLSTQTGIDINSLLQVCRLSESSVIGLAQGGDTSTVLLDMGASEQDNSYVGCQIALYPKNTHRIVRTIVAYHGTGRAAEVDTPLPAQMATGTPYRITGLAVQDSSQDLIRENWLLYSTLASSVLDAVNAKYEDAEFEEIYSDLTDTLNSIKRDALLGYTIWLMNKRFAFIRQPSDLYQYLLIDTEMGGCMTTTPIVEGIAAVQLYMQRCRMNLEPGVTEIPIPDAWWQWMSAYRVWEANRRVFLYPENYVEPTLRRSQTPQFREMSEEMLQTNITNDSVSSAYTTYMEEFTILANLVQNASYRCTRTDPKTKKAVDTLFIVGHTNTTPYTYYFRSVDNFTDTMIPAVWTPWEKIELTINTPYVTPIYAFDRLFLFWSELKNIDSSRVENNTSINLTSSRAVLQYSFLNPGKAWLEPQTLLENVVANFLVNYQADDYVKANAPFLPSRQDAANLFWREPYALHIVPSTYITPMNNAVEKIALFYGYALDFQKGVTFPISTPSSTGNPDEVALNQNVYSVITRVNALISAVNQSPGPPELNVRGYVPNEPGMSLDSSLVGVAGNSVFLDYMPTINEPQPYVPALNRIAAKLGIQRSLSVLYDNYYGDNSAYAKFKSDTALGMELLYNIAKDSASIWMVKNQPGWFLFDNGNESFLAMSQEPGLKTITDILTLSDSQAPLPAGELYYRCRPYTSTPQNFDTLQFAFARISTHTGIALSSKLRTGGIQNLLTIESQETPELPFNRFYQSPGVVPPHVIPPTSDKLDFNGAYGNYFWEIFFYGPFLIADQLNTNQRFEEAKAWYEYIFNPTQPLVAGEPDNNDRYWRFLPFRHLTIDTLTDILTNPAQIAVYNNDPFDPDAIARLRPTAYPKAIVMRYIDNLINWGDYLFSLDTRESITQATNLYVMASDLLGQKPESVGECSMPAPANFRQIKAQYNKVVNEGTAQSGTVQTITLASTASSVNGAYNEMTIDIVSGTGSGQRRIISLYNGTTKIATVDTAWDTIPDNTSQYRVNGVIPQFLIQLENSSLVMGNEIPGINYTDVPFNEINSYFCVPENEEFVAYWDTIEDRLFKIRHCMNIDGVERSLALFAPPLNPRDLIRAAASGSGGSGLAPQIEPPIPNYRFSVVIDTVKGLTSTVAQLGASLLTALEKQDAEELSMLMNLQQQVLLGLTTSIKEQQIEQVNETGVSLQASLTSAQYRYDYYNTLVAKGLSAGEIQSMQALEAALVFNVLASVTKTASSIAYTIPNVGSPFAMTYGGVQIGSALSAASSVLEIGSMISSFIAERSLTMSGYQRRSEEWQFQAQLASYDVQQINAQIAANNIQKQIAQRELEVHLKTVEQNAEIIQFLKTKFTNKELYQWMSSRLLTVYFQTYTLAVELARSAQRAFQYELNNDKTFVNFHYWDDARKGLLAGEGLMLALNQMEKAYLDGNTRTLEIEKTISLLQLNPKALLDLKNNGECTFEFTEKLFDYDFPGHYCRKIKSVSVTIPAVVGPYQNIKATFTQLGNQVVLRPNVDAVNFLLGGSTANTPGADTLRSNWWVNQQIAISRGVSDSGMFELNFNDPRYLPFEGTGAVSSWRLSMPKATNRIDFDAISDVLVQIRYTAIDGGAAFRRQVTSLPALKPYAGARFLSLHQQYSQQWYTFMNEHPDPDKQIMSFPMTDPVPPHVSNAKLTGFYFVLDVPEGVDTTSSTPYIIFELTNDVAVEVKPGPNNSYTFILPNQPSMTGVVGIRRIIFDLDNTPNSLKKGGYLDPAVLQNIGIIFYYKGDVTW